ncbi:unnamed protein product [Mytilus coruscus]|uniref:Zinc finger PHD-type domain-containing protein n=1 Tax=Mytilus coruscus TaxID=42192 RepID=A0A6J8CSX6_MYTCO|nr:unnamed protein product [Mytilus coruscus]
MHNKRKLTLVRKCSKPSEMFAHFKHVLDDFAGHQFRAYWQNAQLKSLKENVSQNNCIVVHDYSENYACKERVEVQSTYFQRTEVTIHVSIIYRHSVLELDGVKSFPDDPCIVTEHFFVISSDEKQDQCFTSKVQSLVKEYFDSISYNCEECVNGNYNMCTNNVNAIGRKEIVPIRPDDKGTIDDDENDNEYTMSDLIVDGTVLALYTDEENAEFYLLRASSGPEKLRTSEVADWALKKKLDATKRTEISYEITGGGLTAELDAISFELLLFACKTLYNDMSNVRTDISKDKSGNIVQYTFMVKDDNNGGYAINLYTTRCSMLVNGKKTNYFIQEDLGKIHSIMRKTNMKGIKIDKDNLNKLLADKFEYILNNVEANNTTSADSNPVKCLKCKRNCKTRAVQCIIGHWVHYSCEKLSLTEIQNLPHIDYCCKTCSKQPITVPYAITAAEVLLREETIDDEKCLVCNDEMTDDKQACPTCNHISHNKCFNINSDQCYSCHAIEEQRTLSENQTRVENTEEISTKLLTTKRM